jgi:hypothetical protein
MMVFQTRQVPGNLGKYFLYRTSQIDWIFIRTLGRISIFYGLASLGYSHGILELALCR